MGSSNSKSSDSSESSKEKNCDVQSWKAGSVPSSLSNQHRYRFERQPYYKVLIFEDE